MIVIASVLLHQHAQRGFLSWSPCTCLQALQHKPFAHPQSLGVFLVLQLLFICHYLCSSPTPSAGGAAAGGGIHTQDLHCIGYWPHNAICGI
jgi:hypothetical protein